MHKHIHYVKGKVSHWGLHHNQYRLPYFLGNIKSWYGKKKTLSLPLLKVNVLLIDKHAHVRHKCYTSMSTSTTISFECSFNYLII